MTVVWLMAVGIASMIYFWPAVRYRFAVLIQLREFDGRIGLAALS
jgi:hypothetical protein